MKKLALLISFVLLLALFSACSVSTSESSAAPAKSGSETAGEGDVSAPEEPAGDATTPIGGREIISILFWGANDDQRAAFQKNLIDVYNATQDEYEIVMEFRNTLDTEIPVMLAANSGPDIVYSSGPSFCNVYVKENKLVDLTPYSEQYGWKDRLLPALYDACTVQGKLFSLPNAISVGGIYYNKDLFEKKGWKVPTTIAEVEQIMDAAMADGLYGAAAGNRNWRPCNDNFSSVMVNHFVSPTNIYDCLTGAQSFTNPDMVAAVAKTQEWYKKGYLSGSDYTSLETRDCVQLVADERAAFFFSPSLLIQLCTTTFEGKEDKFGFAPMPALYKEGAKVYDVSMPCTFSINAAAKYPDECAKILDIMMTAKFAQGMTETWPGYWSVPLRDMSEIDTSNMQGLSKAFMELIIEAGPEIAAGNFGFHPSTFFPPTTQEKWRDIDSVWQEVMTPEEFLKEVDAAAIEERAADMLAPLAKPAI